MLDTDRRDNGEDDRSVVLARAKAAANKLINDPDAVVRENARELLAAVEYEERLS